MRILQSGVAKGGNYWVYTILRSLFDEAGADRQSHVRQLPVYEDARSWRLSNRDQANIDVVDVIDGRLKARIGSRFFEPIDDVASHVAGTSHLWTHSAWSGPIAEVVAHVDRIIYVIRDPRDVALSLARFAFTPYFRDHYPHGERSPEEYLRHRLYGNVLSWTDHVLGYLEQRVQHDIHVVFYERLLADLGSELTALTAYLGLDLGAEQIERVRAAVAFDAMKERAPGHVRRGRAGGWRHELTPLQQWRVRRLAGPALTFLGYPLHADEHSTPALPTSFDEPALDSLRTRTGGSALDSVLNAYSLAASRRPLSEKFAKGLSYIGLGSRRSG